MPSINVGQDDLNRIHDRIDNLGQEMRVGFKELGEKFTGHLLQYQQCRGDCNRIVPIVLGDNQTKPIVQRVDENETDIVSVKKEIKEHKARLWKVAAAVASGITALVTLILRYVLPKVFE